MITIPAGARILLATRPVDFRKGGHSLAALAQEVLGEDPFSGAVIVYRAKRSDRVKILVWDSSGLVLIWKQLQQGSFRWPPIMDGVMAFCWSHVRRGFFDLAKSKAPIATEALKRIAALYEVEARIRGKSAADRLVVRQAESKALVTELRTWFEAQLASNCSTHPLGEKHFCINGP